MRFPAIAPLLASPLGLAACSDAVPNPNPEEAPTPPAIEARTDPDVKIDVPGFKLRVDGDEGNVEIVAGEVEITVRGDEDRAEVAIRGPSTRVDAGDHVRLGEEELGLPFYPGAERARGARIETDDTRVLVQRLRSEDDLDDVVHFYESRLEGFERNRDWDGVEFEREVGDEERKVEIEREGGETAISLVYARRD